MIATAWHRGRYLETVAAVPPGTIPNITSVRGLNPKLGFGVSVEQTLAAGGLGGFLGDGRLNYAREEVAEVEFRV